MVPVTITQAAREYCPHRPRHLQRERYDLDGTSPPAPTNAIAFPQIFRRYSVESDPTRRGLFHSNRRSKQGTWGTRMRQTKCWRCELKARRRESIIALHGHCKGLRRRLGDFKAMLRWTCCCSYAAYEDDADNETHYVPDVQSQAREDRMGGGWL